MPDSWLDVDGFVLPKPISGHAALEFCNTQAGWGERKPSRHEYLISYAHLVVFAREAGVLAPARAAALLNRFRPENAGTRRQLKQAHQLRGDCRAALLREASVAALHRVERAATGARAQQILVASGGSHRWTWPGAPTLAEPLKALTLAVADLLVDERVGGVRACPRPDCGWLFLDTTSRRRWCQMAVCGNRAKQERIRHRR